MKVCKKDIVDDQIVELYNNGWSINDIVAHYRASVKRVRGVLQGTGAQTSRYRAAPPRLKERLLAVSATGLPVRELEERTDYSSHLIRQVLREKQVTATEWRMQSNLDLSELTISENAWKEFVSLYLLGERGFMPCAEACGFSPRDCAEGVLRLTPREVKEHREKLFENISLQHSHGLSAITISKKMGVSPSVVKKIFASLT